jgi:hypothetical protein
MNRHEHTFPEAEWPFDAAIDTATFTTTRVVREGYPVLRVSHDCEGDWQFLCGTTHQSEDCLIVCFGCAYQRDRSIGELADLPLGWQAWRDSPGDPWERYPGECEDDDV